MLQIGSLAFSSNLIQGPLAGYSCSAFRRLVWQVSQPAYCVSEMISARDLTSRKKPIKRYIHRSHDENILSYQLSGTNPLELAEAAKKVSDYGADLIDLNCGCPVAKIRKTGAGSALLETPSQLASMVEAMKKATDRPITVKIRVDGNSNDHYHLAIAKTIESAGADALIVHGRHWTDNYETPVHYHQIKEIVESVQIPVIGNGDVDGIDSLRKMEQITGCQGVMIARAGVGQPWLFEQLEKRRKGETYIPPNLKTRMNLFLEHLKALANLESETIALLQMRKLVKYYVRERIELKELPSILFQAISIKSLEQSLISFF